MSSQVTASPANGNGVGVGGTGVAAVGFGVAVGGTGVAVGGTGVAVGAGTEVAVGSGTAVAVGAVVAVETGADVAGAEAVSPPPHAIIPNRVALSVITRSFLSSCTCLSFSSIRAYYAGGRFYHNAADNGYKKDLIDTEILDFTLEDITKVALTF